MSLLLKDMILRLVPIMNIHMVYRMMTHMISLTIRNRHIALMIMKMEFYHLKFRLK